MEYSFETFKHLFTSYKPNPNETDLLFHKKRNRSIMIDNSTDSVIIIRNHGTTIFYNRQYPDLSLFRNSEKINWMFYAMEKELFAMVIEPDNKVAKAIITYLGEHEIPFKVIQLGGGVKKIIKKDNVCPCCKGSGLVNPEKIVNYPHQQHGVDFK